jgi:hypothetical protein
MRMPFENGSGKLFISNSWYPIPKGKTDAKPGSAIWRKPGGSGRTSDFIFLFLE